jgi:hypothetical protein
MSAYPDSGLCEACEVEAAEIYADGEWLCSACELEASEEPMLLTALERAELWWGEARIVK